MQLEYILLCEWSIWEVHYGPYTDAFIIDWKPWVLVSRYACLDRKTRILCAYAMVKLCDGNGLQCCSSVACPVSCVLWMTPVCTHHCVLMLLLCLCCVCWNLPGYKCCVTGLPNSRVPWCRRRIPYLGSSRQLWPMVAKVIIQALDIYDDTGSYPRILAASVDFRKYAIISSLDQQNVNAVKVWSQLVLR